MEAPPKNLCAVFLLITMYVTQATIANQSICPTCHSDGRILPVSRLLCSLVQFRSWAIFHCTLDSMCREHGWALQSGHGEIWAAVLGEGNAAGHAEWCATVSRLSGAAGWNTGTHVLSPPLFGWELMGSCWVQCVSDWFSMVSVRSL